MKRTFRQDPRVESLQAKRTHLLENLRHLNAKINDLQMRAYQRVLHRQGLEMASRPSPGIKNSDLRSTDSSVSSADHMIEMQELIGKPKVTPGLRLRLGLMQFLQGNNLKGVHHKVRTAASIEEWQEERTKARDTVEATELYMQSQIMSLKQNLEDEGEDDGNGSNDEASMHSDLVLKYKRYGHHPTIRIYGGGSMRINICIPLSGDSMYSFGQLMEDITEFWSLPLTNLVPRFVLVANADPFANNMIYDFKPHIFDPEDSVIDELTHLSQDPSRGFGTQTGMPPQRATYPWLHCQPNVSGDELSTLAHSPQLQPQFFSSCLAKYSKLNENRPPKRDKILGYDCFKTVVLEDIGGKLDAQLSKTADEVFHKWSDKSSDDAQVIDGKLSMEAFSWLVDDWDRIRKDRQILKYDMSAIEAWKCFRKPTRFMDHRTHFLVRFDEFKNVVLKARPMVSTVLLRKEFDTMDEQQRGAIQLVDFKKHWANLKINLLTDDGMKPGQSKSFGDVVRKARSAIGGFFSFPESSGIETINPKHKKFFRLVIVYIVVLVCWIFVLNRRRSVSRAYHITASSRQILGENARFGSLNENNFLAISSRDDLWDWLQGPLTSIMTGNSLKYAQDTAYSEYQSQEYIKPEIIDEDLKSRRSIDFNVTRDFSVSNTKEGLRNRFNGNAVLTPPTVRIRQVRVKASSCTALNPVVCYPAYSLLDRDEHDIENSLTHDRYATTKTNLSAAFKWQNKLYPEGTGIGKTEDTADYIGTQIRVMSSKPRNVYDASGYYIDLPMDHFVFTSILKELRKSEWLDREKTRAVIIQFVSYYPEADVYLQANFLAEMLPSGAIRTSFSLLPVNLRMYDVRSSSDELFIIIFECVVSLFALGMLLLDATKYIWPHLFENTASNIFSFKSVLCVGIVSGSVSRLAYLFLSSREHFEASGPPDMYAGFIDLNKAANYHNIGFVIDGFVAISLIFRTLAIMRHLPNCDNTRFFILNIMRLSRNIMYYACLYLIFLLLVATFGHGVFGAQMIGYESYQQAVITLTMAAVGQIDFVAHYRVNPYIAGPYMIIYQVIIGLVAAKMFMVAVIQTYIESVNENASTSEQEDDRQYHWLEILSMVFPCIRRSNMNSDAQHKSKKRSKKRVKKKNLKDLDAVSDNTKV